MMPRKIDKRKALQAARIKAEKAADAKRNKRWPGTRRDANSVQKNLDGVDMAVIAAALLIRDRGRP